MITIGARREIDPEILMGMHEFRHEVFVRRLGWALPLMGGIERDEYDSEDAVYVLARNGDGSITGCARLLPTEVRCMITDLFPELFGNEAPPCDPRVWELSRFAMTSRQSAMRSVSLSHETSTMLCTIVKYVESQGVRRLIMVTQIAIERLLRRAGFKVERASAPANIDGSSCVALYIDVPVPHLIDVAGTYMQRLPPTDQGHSASGFNTMTFSDVRTITEVPRSTAQLMTKSDIPELIHRTNFPSGKTESRMKEVYL